MIKLPEEILNGISEEKILYNEPMSRHTAVKTGGNASVVLLPSTISELLLILNAMRGFKRLAVIGGGENSLFPDNGYNGVVVKTCGIRHIEQIGDYISVTAGVSMREIAEKSLEYGLCGMEWAVTDGGSLGAATAYNSSRFGREMSDSLYAFEVVTRQGELLTLTPDMCNMHKRKTDITQNGHIVLRAMLQLKTGKRDAIHRDMLRYERLEGLDAALASARAKNAENTENGQAPDIEGATGVSFRGPVYVDNLGGVIKACGLCGTVCGDAYLSYENPLRIINKKAARSSDIKGIAEKVIMTVLEKKNMQVFPEISMFGKV